MNREWQYLKTINSDHNLTNILIQLFGDWLGRHECGAKGEEQRVAQDERNGGGIIGLQSDVRRAAPE